MGTIGLLGIVVLIIAALALVLLVWFIGMYNGLVRNRNEVKNAWSQIDVQLKRRHDLIPNLVETVKGYAAHERGTLDEVIAARARAVGAGDMTQRIQAEGELSQALGRLMMVAEAYPQLKANQNFLALQEELTSTENRIGYARQFYNDSVMNYNTRIQQFPASVVAGIGGFRESPFFEIEDRAQREAPQVKFT